MERGFTGREPCDSAGDSQPEGSEPPREWVRDIYWAGERRTAVRVAGLLLTAFLAVDGAAASITWLRTAGWAGLAALLFVILLPPRISARQGVLSARGLLTERTVRTDSLVSVHWHNGIAQRMALQDAEGHRVEIDPNVLIRNPALWHRLDVDSRASLERGTLLYGATALRRLAERIDREAARKVFQVSQLD